MLQIKLESIYEINMQTSNKRAVQSSDLKRRLNATTLPTKQLYCPRFFIIFSYKLIYFKLNPNTHYMIKAQFN